MPLVEFTCHDPRESEEPPGNPSVPNLSSLVAPLLVKTAQGRTLPSTPPVLPPPRPLSPMDMDVSNWDLYESPLCGGIGSKRRRNSRAGSPPEAPPRKGPRRMGSVPLTDLRPAPPFKTIFDSASGARRAPYCAPQVEPAPEAERVSISNRGSSLGDARDDNDATEGDRHGDVRSSVEPLHVGLEAGPTSRVASVPPSPNAATGATSHVSTYAAHTSRDLITF